ncbi:hypothetical protein J6590_056728 [Homalodisca vitripennis]|nr:hypothetical protein J6590_056728 [Homalodisca vitripennis]
MFFISASTGKRYTVLQPTSLNSRKHNVLNKDKKSQSSDLVERNSNRSQLHVASPRLRILDVYGTNADCTLYITTINQPLSLCQTFCFRLLFPLSCFICCDYDVALCLSRHNTLGLLPSVLFCFCSLVAFVVNGYKRNPIFGNSLNEKQMNCIALIYNMQDC